MKVKVKVCGITNLEDALFAESLGADAIGFIFYKKSPRYIRPNKAMEIADALPPMLKTVGVFVNEDIKRIQEIRDEVGLDLIQLHGDEGPEFCKALMPRVIKALRVGDDFSRGMVDRFKGVVRGILLDTWSKDARGGTGKTFNWEIAKAVVKGCNMPTILAGGINPGNVKEAIDKVRPYGLDVSSGVESSPGIKDHELMREFFRAVEISVRY